MNNGTFVRRDALRLIAAAAGATGLPAGTLWPGAVHAAGAPAYSPAARFDLVVSEVELRRNSAGRMLMARIYQPKGPGPFPTVLDLHGGAWNRKDRFAEEPMDRALASSGLLVVAVDLTVAPEAPYPACVQDANFAVRWLKVNAATWNGDTSKIGIYASSSGGHVAELLAMRPRDPGYNSIPLAAAANVDASVAYVAMRSPVSNTFARYENAERRRNESMVKNNKVFFHPWETIHESNPRKFSSARKRSAWCRFSLCRAPSMTTCCRRCRKNSSRPTGPPAATVIIACSKTPFTNGSRSRVLRPTRRSKWSRNLSRAS